MGLIRRLGKETMIYGSGKALSSIIAIFFVPIYTRLLGSQGYGFVDTINVAISLIFILTVSGLDTAVGFYYFDYRNDSDRRRVLFSGILYRMIASLILPLLALPLFLTFISGRSAEAATAVPFIILGLTRIPFMTLQNFCRDTMRLENRVWLFFWTTLVYSLLAVFFPILFVIILHRGVLGVFEAALAAEAMTGLAFLTILWPRLRYSLDLSLIKRLLTYGLPILPTSFMFYAMSSADRFFILGKMGLSSAGIYAVGNKLAMIMVFAINSYQLAWGVFGLSIKDNPEAKAIYSRVFLLYSLGFGFLCVAVTLFSYEGLVILTTPEFYPAVGIVGFLCLGQLVYGMYNQVGIGSIVSKMTRNIPISGAAGLVVNIIGNVILIDLFGLAGAAIATLLGYMTCVIVIYILSQKVYQINYRITPIVISLIMATAASIFMMTYDSKTSWSLIAGKAAILLLIAPTFFAMERYWKKRI